MKGTRWNPIDVYLSIFVYGGIEAETHQCFIHELAQAGSGIRFMYQPMGDDALISRSRSRVVQRFFDSPARVLVMIDHDIAWEPGDVCALVRKCEETRGIVGGVYPCRSFRAGVTSRLKDQGVRWVVGGEGLHDAQYVATGFLAIHREAIEKMVQKLDDWAVAPNFKLTKVVGLGQGEPDYYDFFRPVTVESDMVPGRYEYLSEDWAFCLRARAAGVSLHLYEKPVLVHFGRVPHIMSPEQISK